MIITHIYLVLQRLHVVDDLVQHYRHAHGLFHFKNVAYISLLLPKFNLFNMLHLSVAIYIYIPCSIRERCLASTLIAH